ncbi:hypothetical protein KPH14_011195 [Odynerus spinipes]|uniref:DUF1907 domain-containing protein n=1 Tax=Odynerus spinipes TaxID=1348599 RepID=A0AAD9VI63_9HYME|nr:hypothetical protein KPH14_011195 [Odynerus spinipes]
MTTLDVEKLKIVKRSLHVPSLHEVKSVLEEELSKNFAEVKVEVVDCPDLMEAPFSLSTSGLNGDPTVLEVGGPSYLLPLVQKDKLYDIQPLLKHLNYSDKAFVIGAGAGPWPYLNCNCEMMMNVAISPSSIKNGTYVASVDKSDGNCILERLNGNETRFALLANLFVSKGETGLVLKVHVKRRTGKDDFIACMQKALACHYNDKLVGIGGTFLINNGKVKQHVMSDFSTTPLNNMKQLNEWLNFYDMSTPLVAVGTFVSSETDLDLRVQHFHSFSHHGEGGHYHIDTTPETIEYLGYFNLGTNLYRIDKPADTLQFGKD